MKDIIIIAAMTKNGVIGKDGKLPWHHPEDLAHFKKETCGRICVFGRKTYESLPKRPLTERKNFVISRTRPAGKQEDGSIVFHSLQSAIDVCKDHHTIYICGGAEIYAEAIPLATGVEITIIPGEYEGDTIMPKENELNELVKRCIEAKRFHSTMYDDGLIIGSGRLN